MVTTPLHPLSPPLNTSRPRGRKVGGVRKERRVPLCLLCQRALPDGLHTPAYHFPHPLLFLHLLSSAGRERGWQVRSVLEQHTQSQGPPGLPWSSHHQLPLSPLPSTHPLPQPASQSSGEAPGNQSRMRWSCCRGRAGEKGPQLACLVHYLTLVLVALSPADVVD